MRNLIAVLAAVFPLLTLAAARGSFDGQVCDEAGNCATVTGNKLDVNATVNATAVGTATAAAPTYVEGSTTAPFSFDLSGNLRTLATATVGATATAAAPTYLEGATGQALSLDLSGYLRMRSFQLPAALVGGRLDVNVGAELPAGTNQIGHVITDPTSVSTPYFSGAQVTTANPLPVQLRSSGGTELTQPLTDTQLRATSFNVTPYWNAGVVATTNPIPVQLRTSAGVEIGQNANGQTTMENAAPVVIASDQSAVPASQSGTWTVQPGNTANTTPWLVTNREDLTGWTTVTSGVSTATTLTELIAASGSDRIYIKNWKCSASVASSTTANEQCQLVYGTGSNCGTGTNVIDACFQAANSGCNGMEIVIPASQAACWRHAAAGSKVVTITYKQAP